MKFSTTTRYGLRAIVYIARCKKTCSVKEISKAEDIPVKYLEKIIIKLSKSGFIGVKRGATGGYFLARPADEITVEDIVRVLETHTSPAPCINAAYECPRQCFCPTRDIWEKVYDSINRTLINITLEDLVK